jgi:hypothetical protein
VKHKSNKKENKNADPILDAFNKSSESISALTIGRNVNNNHFQKHNNPNFKRNLNSNYRNPNSSN